MTGFAHRMSGIAFAMLLACSANVKAQQIFYSGFETLPCVGLECQQVDCPAPGQTTTVSGKVFAPNGTLPLPNVIVYVPNAELAALPEGVQCARCDIPPSGSPLVITRTAADGSFQLTDVPVGAGVPLVIQSGKWRRKISVASVGACTDTAVANGVLRFPRNQSEGNMPLIALSTGGADAQECLLRKLGIDDAEFTPGTGTGRMHLYAGSGGTDAIDASNGGEALSVSSTTLWASEQQLGRYDMVVLSCEGSQVPETKPVGARNALQAYADVGGRVSIGHWHNYWIQSGPAPWPTIATWEFLSDLGVTTMDIATGFPRGDELSQWVVSANASATAGKITIPSPQHTTTAVDPLLARRRVFRDVTANGKPTIQYFSFTTPVGDPIDSRCGRVAFSELHASSGDASNPAIAFPSGGCMTPVGTLTQEEKLLAYLLFDLGSCVGNTIE